MLKKFLLFAMLLSAAGIFAASFKKGSKVYVSVKTAELKSGTGFFSDSVCEVSYGDVLTVIESDSKMTRVSPVSKPSVSGWIANGSVTSKKITKKSGSAVNASSGELALAGKGLSAEAEKAFKSSGAKLNYAEVDRMEKITVSDTDLADFIKEGQLKGGRK